MLTTVLCYAQPLNKRICTASEYFLKLPISVTPIRIIPAIRHFSVTADLRICKVKHTLDIRYLRGAISAVLTTSLVVTCDSVNFLLGNHMKFFNKVIFSKLIFSFLGLISPVENQMDLGLDFKVFFFADSCCSNIVLDESN